MTTRTRRRRRESRLHTVEDSRAAAAGVERGSAGVGPGGGGGRRAIHWARRPCAGERIAAVHSPESAGPARGAADRPNWRAPARSRDTRRIASGAPARRPTRATGSAWAVRTSPGSAGAALHDPATGAIDRPTWRTAAAQTLRESHSRTLERATPSPAGLRVPLREGLTIVTAIATDDGDYESIKRITSVTDDTVSLTLSADVPVWVVLDKDYFSQKHTKGTRHVVSKRTVLRVDLKVSHEYAQLFNERTPEFLPGTTAITTSAAVLQALKDPAGQSEITYQVPDLGGPETVRARILRVEPRPVPFPVLLNGRRVELPALHAYGIVEEFYFLNDPENPIVLAWDLGRYVGKLQVIKISLSTEPPGQMAGAGNPPGGGGAGGGSAGGAPLGGAQAGGGGGASPAGGQAGGSGGGANPAGGGPGTAQGAEGPIIKQSLQQTGRAEVYGIYFEFAKATIREESEPVLKAIADLMTQNLTWKLSVEGHTDNIGTDAYNLDLSKRRAAAVKQALVGRYHIAANRLTTAGFGASRPKESNDTLPGRARNRRVELVRQ